MVDWFQHLAMRPAVTDKVQVEPRGVQPLLRQRLARRLEESVKGEVRWLGVVGDEVVAGSAEQRHGALREEHSDSLACHEEERPSAAPTGARPAWSRLRGDCRDARLLLDFTL